MSDWNRGGRDGLPRGYCIAARDQYEPVAPASWMRFDADIGVQMAIELAHEHLGTVNARHPMDVRLLAQLHTPVIVRCNALPPKASTALSVPLPEPALMALPRALAVHVVRTHSDPSIRAEARFRAAVIDGAPQESWMFPWYSSEHHLGRSTYDMDSGLAWPCDGWACFVPNDGYSRHRLELHFSNPSLLHTIDIEAHLFCDLYEARPTPVATLPCAKASEDPYR